MSVHLRGLEPVDRRRIAGYGGGAGELHEAVEPRVAHSEGPAAGEEQDAALGPRKPVAEPAHRHERAAFVEESAAVAVRRDVEEVVPRVGPLACEVVLELGAGRDVPVHRKHVVDVLFEQLEETSG
jgi:hypothetical protein